METALGEARQSCHGGGLYYVTSCYLIQPYPNCSSQLEVRRGWCWGWGWGWGCGRQTLTLTLPKVTLCADSATCEIKRNRLVGMLMAL